MKPKRQLVWVLVALILAALGTGNLFAQDGENAGIPTNVGYPSNPSAPANPGSPSYDPPARVAGFSTSPVRSRCSLGESTTGLLQT